MLEAGCAAEDNSEFGCFVNWPLRLRRALEGAVTAASIALAICLALPGTLPAATTAAVREAVDETYASERYQVELPDEAIEIERPRLPDWDLPEWLIEFLRLAAWTAVIVVGLLLAFRLLMAAPGLRARLRRTRVEPAGDGSRVIEGRVPESLDAALAEADRLAAQGDYAAALHMLLLYSLDAVRRHLGLHLADSLTSREILRLPALPEGNRRALGTIVTAAELTHFGGRPADAAMYGDCRRRCEDIGRGGGA